MTLPAFRHSITGKILSLTLGITLLLLAAIIYLVNRQGTAQVEQNIDDNLGRAISVFGSLQERRLTSLREQGSNISTDYRLRSTLQLGDQNTLKAARRDLGETYDFDLFWVLTNDDRLIADDGIPLPKIQWLRQQAVIKDAGNGFDSADLWLDAGQVYEVSASPVMAADAVIGILIIGNRIDDVLLANLRELTGVSFLVLVAGTVASTSDATNSDTVLAPDSTLSPSFVRMGDEEYVAQATPIANVEAKLLGTLLARKSWDEAIAPLRQLQSTLLVIGITSLLVTTLAGILMVRRIAAPIQRLVANAQSIGQGNYDTRVEVDSDDEIGHLAREFEDMRLSLREAQRQLIISERMSIVGRMAGSIIHDFKQPITTIYGIADLLDIEPDAESRRRYGLVIRQEIDRMMAMVNQLLEFAKGDSALKFSRVAVEEVLAEAVTSFRPAATAANIELTLAVVGMPAVTADRARIRRVLDNLLRNALDAVGRDGTVTLRASHGRGKVVIEVLDSGRGIPESIRENLFDAFVTSGKTTGTGLGLAIVKQVVEDHGGTIHFETEADRGTTFVITLPAAGEV